MRFKLIPIQISFILVLATTFSGCDTTRYYAQAIQGQLSLISKRKPIHKLLMAPHIPPGLKARFKTIREIRDFAQNQLHLTVDGNYRDYVELNRPYVVWAVYAAPEFSLAPHTWCYPLVGCLSYRSYFSEDRADRYAVGLRDEGYDAYVQGIAAYSTLGWFDDPILSSFVDYSDTDLAALIFHELAHGLLYVSGDTTFNESFATAVEQEGIRRWMLTRQTPEAYGNYMKRHGRYQQFVGLIMQYRKKLATLYKRSLSPKDMRPIKAMIIERLRKAYQKRKKEWDGYAGYDNWFNRPVNNAQINTVSTYHALVPGFLNLLQTTGGNLEHFYQRCKQLAQEPLKARHRHLQKQSPPG